METQTDYERRGKGTGSYRTYEEWKRSSISEQTGGMLGSYRTYEEWKL